MPVFIDKPDRDISDHCIDVRGWVAADGPPPAIRVVANGRQVRHILHDRPDVRRTLPGFGFVAGVHAPLTVFDLDPCDTLEIVLSCGADVASLTCVLPPVVQQARAADATLRLAARDKCVSVLVCPACGSAAIRAQADAARIVCVGCGEAFSQARRAINMIPQRLDSDGAAETDNLALLPAADAARALIRRVTGDGGWVLDCGAGRPAPRVRHVVTVGATDHGRLDVRAAAEALPFADASFDAAVSLAMLDQVGDPVACARELLRVVKPGGEVLAAVPSLRPAASGADRTYNLEQLGLEQLFAAGGEVIEATPAAGGAPFPAVQALLREYLAMLPDAARDTLAAMTIGEAAVIDPSILAGGPSEQRSGPPTGLPDGWLSMVRVRRR